MLISMFQIRILLATTLVVTNSLLIATGSPLPAAASLAGGGIESSEALGESHISHEPSHQWIERQPRVPRLADSKEYPIKRLSTSARKLVSSTLAPTSRLPSGTQETTPAPTQACTICKPVTTSKPDNNEVPPNVAQFVRDEIQKNESHTYLWVAIAILLLFVFGVIIPTLLYSLMSRGRQDSPSFQRTSPGERSSSVSKTRRTDSPSPLSDAFGTTIESTATGHSQGRPKIRGPQVGAAPNLPRMMIKR